MFVLAREGLLFAPPALAGLSLFYVGTKVLFGFRRRNTSTVNGKTNGTPHTNGLDSDGSTKSQSLAETIRDLDGWSILFFRISRLLAVLALLSLQVFQLSAKGSSTVRNLEFVFCIYSSVLAIFTIISAPRWRDVASRQLALLLLVDSIVFFTLDVWPYATTSPHPYDPASDPVTWVRVSLLAFCGIIVPLIMPRPFRPSKPGAIPGADEVCSILSRVTYSFLDGIVWYAYRVPDVTVDAMPHLPEQEKIETLSKHALDAVDPVLLSKKRHLVWGYLRVWGKDYVWLTIWTTLHTVTRFAGVFGTRSLLLYLESGELSYGLRPWFWIIVLAFGPVVSACLYTQFLYVGTRIVVESTSVFTYIVFHHSLRIRMKSDTLATEDEKKKIKEAASASTSDDTSTHASTTPAAADTETEGDVQEGIETRPSEIIPEGGHAKEKTGAIVGKINNLITTDLTTLANAYNVVSFPVVILQFLISVVLLYNLLSWSAIVGLGIMIVLSPVPVYVGQLMVKVQQKKMGMTDKRVQAVTETMNILRMIKLFAWEPFVLKQLSQRRDEELSKIRTGRLLDAVMTNVNQILPLLSKLATFAVYTLVQKGDLSASRIFSALMLFSMTEEQLFNIMYSVPELLRAKVSFDRYTEFLNSTELLDEGQATLGAGEEATTIGSPGYPKDAIGFNDCTFSWDSFDTKESTTPGKHTRKRFNLRFDGEVTFKRGVINLVVGPTASGKTSVLMALLGEMYHKPHGITSWYNLPRDGGIAYHPQESWVINATIKDNILFAEPFNEERYKKVLKHCALERDLRLWEAGDLTEIGEKGLTLSGGQKARVTLARALYSSASILLLDDVLAALDVHTAKWIVDKALRGDFVKGRTVVLVTHNIALAAPVAQHVIVLGRQGSVTAQGPVNEVLKNDPRLRDQVEKDRKTVEENIETNLDEDGKDEDETAKQAAGKLVVAEEKAMGRVEWAAFMLYIEGIGGPIVWIIILGAVFVATVFWIGQTYFIGYWSSQYELYPSSEIPVLTYLGIYAFICVMTLAVDTIQELIWVFRALRSSAVLHYRLLESVFSATFRWLDITPIGRIITRCTQDVATIDGPLAQFAGIFMRITVSLLGLLFSMVLTAGLYAFIPGLMVAGLGSFLGYMYLKCQLCIRREMSNAKAPVMSQVGAALTGLPTIRAYGAQAMFHKELEKRIDLYTRTSLVFYNINRWISVRADSLGGIFAGVISAYLTYGGQILFWVRIYNLLEIQANSLERVLEYLRIEHEPKPTESGEPAAYWPSSGSLRVEKLSAKYSDDSPEVLRDISFNVASGERIAIVGRTGAGKSSIALALLRAIKTSGKVYYDDVATDEINLDALRSHITLIPQQPELLHGTLRENLDPFGQHDDATLNDALQAAGLFDIRETATSEQPNAEASGSGQLTSQAAADTPETNGSDVNKDDSKIGLDTMVESGGTNFSLGQRQIIALARAIVRRSKLLILDEATAAIDYETDAAIQRTLRTEFSKDTTFITIAHRLQTIIDYDKIMVLDAGQLVEYDTPKELLKIPKGLLRALVDESDDRETLLKLAGVDI